MIEILFNGDKTVENKPYYKSIFAKIKNKNSIISMSLRISYSNEKPMKELDKEFKIRSRLYKIRNNTNNIPFEYVYKIIKKKFNQDIANTIILFYLRDSISFTSMTVKNSNTIEINICIKYSEKINKYKSFIDYQNSDLHQDFKTIKIFVSLIAERFEYFMNNSKIFDISDIFINNNYDMIDFFVDYKIFNTYKRYGGNGWGIEFDTNKF